MRPARKPEPRDRQLNLSLTAAELTSVRRRAEAADMRPAHFSRALILDESRAPARNINVDHSATRLLYLQLSRLGNNLNQIVRHLHRHGGPIPSGLEALLDDIRRLIGGHLSR